MGGATRGWSRARLAWHAAMRAPMLDVREEISVVSTGRPVIAMCRSVRGVGDPRMRDACPCSGRSFALADVMTPEGAQPGLALIWAEDGQGRKKDLTVLRQDALALCE